MNTSAPGPDATQILRSAADGKLYSCSPESAGALFQAAHSQGHHAYRIDLGLATSEKKLHQILARGLQFPEWYGRNWDALADCLSDMSWHEADGYVLILQRAEILRAAEPESFATFLEILADSARSWKDAGIAFRVLLNGDFPELPRLEVRT